MNTKRTEQILLRATPDEKNRIRKMADSAHLSVQAYVLTAVFQFNDPSLDLTLPAVKRATVPIIAQLRRIGNNLNQLARRQNSGRSISRTDLLSNIEEVESLCRSLKHQPQ